MSKKFEEKEFKQNHNPHDDRQKNHKQISTIEKIAELSEKIKALESQLAEKDSEIEKIKEEAQKVKNDALLIRADAENYRKRIEKDNALLVSRAGERILTELIPTLDSITVAITSTQDEAVRKGLEIVYDSVFGVLKKEGVEEIKAEGEEFNPETMEAYMFEENAESEIDMVSQVLQKGYTHSGRVLRSAKVKVSKGTKTS